MCHLCGKWNETIEHLFLRRQFARAILSGSPLVFTMGSISHTTFTSWWKFWMEKKKEGIIDQEHIIYMSIVLWYIWLARNEKVFNNIILVKGEIVQKFSLLIWNGYIHWRINRRYRI